MTYFGAVKRFASRNPLTFIGPMVGSMSAYGICWFCSGKEPHAFVLLLPIAFAWSLTFLLVYFIYRSAKKLVREEDLKNEVATIGLSDEDRELMSEEECEEYLRLRREEMSRIIDLISERPMTMRQIASELELPLELVDELIHIMNHSGNLERFRKKP